MKKIFLMILFIAFFLIHFIFISSVQASSFDFQLVPRTTKSGSSDGYFSKIPLSPLTIQKGKLDFYKKDGWDFIRFEADYNEKTGELKGIFTGATANNSQNSGGSFYCEFTAQIKKDQKTTTLKYYPTHGTAETLNHCYSQVVFDFENNRKASKDDWWPDDLVFDIQPLNQEEKLEDSGIRFSDIAGEVEILLPTGYDDNGEPIFEDEEGWNHAKLDMELPYGAKLRLKERSGIILAVPGSEPYELKTPENDEATIILPTKQKKDSIFKLMGGQLYNNVKKIVKDGSMDIEMGQAVAGIKGTTFILNETGKESKVAVLEGKVELKSKVKQESIILYAGEQATADSSGLRAKEKFAVSPEIKKWETIKYGKSLSQNKNQFFYGGIIFVLIVIIGGVWFVILKRNSLRLRN